MDQATLTAEQVQQLLGLQPHPTCGFVNESFRSRWRVAAGELAPEYGGQGTRPLGSVLYFMVTAQAHLRLHRIRADQMYHHYLGAPLDVLLLYPEGRGEVRTVGTDLAAGAHLQLFIPGGTFHLGRLRGEGYALLGTTEWPGVEPADVEIGDPDKLISAFPAMRDQILAFTASIDSAHGHSRGV